MTDYIDNLNTQPAFLTIDQPNYDTVMVLETLYGFIDKTTRRNASLKAQENHNSKPSAINQHDINTNYAQSLYDCRLDFSLNSLKRIDTFLSNLKAQFPTVDEAGIYSASYPLADDNVLHILSYYIGEMIGRLHGVAPIWHSSTTEELRLDELKLPPFKVMIAEYLPHANANRLLLAPLTVIYKVLVTQMEGDSTNSNSNSLLNNIRLYLALSSVGSSVDSKSVSTIDSTVSLTKLDNLELENIALERIDTPALDQPLDPINNYLAFDRQVAFENLDRADLSYLQVMPPAWMRKEILSNDPLYEQMRQLGHLYTKGEVVWAQIVQANRLLFSDKEPYCAPVEIIYDPTGRTPPSYLREVAYRLGTLKNTTPDDKELVKYAKHLTNERTRIRFDTPNQITSLPLQTSSLFVWRLHFPNGLLQGAFPIWISDETAEVTVLPAKFWDRVCYRQWMQEGDYSEDMYYSIRKLYKTQCPWIDYQSKLLPRASTLIEAYPNLANKPKQIEPDGEFVDDGLAKLSIHLNLQAGLPAREKMRKESDGTYTVNKYFVGFFVVFILLKAVQLLG